MKRLGPPDLVKSQRESFGRFFQQDMSEGREGVGLQLLLSQTFTAQTSSGRIRVSYLRYTSSRPLFTEEEATENELTHFSSSYLFLRIVTKEGNRIQTEEEECIFLGDFPIMTPDGTFLVNGTSRVVPSQLRRSPGLYCEKGETPQTADNLVVRIVPDTGSWIDFRLDSNKIVCYRTDKKKELPLISLFSEADNNCSNFWESFLLRHWMFFSRTRNFVGISQSDWEEMILPFTIISDRGKVLVGSHNQLSDKNINQLSHSQILVSQVSMEVVTSSYSSLRLTPTEEKLPQAIRLSCDSNNLFRSFLVKTQALRKTNDRLQFILSEEVRIPSEDSTTEIVRLGATKMLEVPIKKKVAFTKMFSLTKKFDLTEKGRQSLNQRIKRQDGKKLLVLDQKDVALIVKYLVKSSRPPKREDDIDHLSHKKLEEVGKLLEQQLIGPILQLWQSVSNIISRSSSNRKLIPTFSGTKTVTDQLWRIFGGEGLTQLLDQTNPLSQLTHVRRLCAAISRTPNRSHASLEIRDIHQSHYGRICPVETPEGQNIGLVNSLATHAQIDPDGILRTPYQFCDSTYSNDVWVYFSAAEETKYFLTSPLVRGNQKMLGRRGSDILLVSPKEICYADVTTCQIVSAAASLIPFLEHNDVNRALMGSNMQRQVVPSLTVEKPIISTGLESNISVDSRCCLLAMKAGTISYCGPDKIAIRPQKKSWRSDITTHCLSRFSRPRLGIRSNYFSAVRTGDSVEPLNVLANNIFSDDGKLSLGNNVLTAFLPWEGHNFEDSVVVSEDLVRQDKYSSVQFEELIIPVQDAEVSGQKGDPVPQFERFLHLDSKGIILVGSPVKSGDLLVQKYVGSDCLTALPEEELILTIFNENHSVSKDSSAFAPKDLVGTTTEIQVISEVERQHILMPKPLSKSLTTGLADLELKTLNQWTSGPVLVDQSLQLNGTDPYELLGQSPFVSPGDSNQRRFSAVKGIQKRISVEATKRKGISQKSVQLPAGVVKLIRIVVAVERQLQPGDKMAGRYGNKGVVSKVVAKEEMPFLRSGRAVSIILNPLGVPSRMNVGQLLETHLSFLAKDLTDRSEKMVTAANLLGWQSDVSYQTSVPAAIGLRGSTKHNQDVPSSVVSVVGKTCLTIATFSGPKGEDLIADLKGAGSFKVSERLGSAGSQGQVFLFNGSTGEEHLFPVTVGYLYYFKLHHLAENKIHVRSTGPYSSVTQQPLAGKAQSGGQRLGEMEVWALEAYGAAYNLQEMLTIKSDDVWGRLRVSRNILRNTLRLESRTPESYKVLTKEAQALGLDLYAEKCTTKQNALPTLLT